MPSTARLLLRWALVSACLLLLTAGVLWRTAAGARAGTAASTHTIATRQATAGAGATPGKTSQSTPPATVAVEIPPNPATPPSPNEGDPANALLLLVGLVLLTGAILVITIGVRSARAQERAEEQLEKLQLAVEQQAQGEPAADEPPAHQPDEDEHPLTRN